MKAHIENKVRPLKGERGQGLVEMMLILPFLLVLVIGIVELGFVLNRQLTVVNAAREGARFGAQGATATDIHTETLLATSQMFNFTEENAVVVVIHAKTKDDGSGFTEWTENIHPEGATTPHVTKAKVLAELKADGGDAKNVKLVAVDVEYDHEAVLGLPFVAALADEIPIGSWTVMRLEAPEGRNPGCCAYPIALDTETVNWPTGWPRGTEMYIRIGPGESQFGWLFWDPDASGSAQNLEYNLRNGCNALNEFKNACDPEDTTLNSDDYISGDSGQAVAFGVRQAIGDLREYHIRLPIWDKFEACNDMPPKCDCKSGTEVAHIVGFAIIKITAVDLTSSPKTINAEFINFDYGCDAE